MDGHDETAQKTSDDFNATTPYRVIASHLVADLVALAKQVFDRRPETTSFGGPLALSIYAATGTIMLALERPDGSAILIEQINGDPKSPEFGASTLRLVAPNGPAH